jgi:hypothetical protein
LTIAMMPARTPSGSRSQVLIPAVRLESKTNRMAALSVARGDRNVTWYAAC